MNIIKLLFSFIFISTSFLFLLPPNKLGGRGIESFYYKFIILMLNPYFKINDSIYRSTLGVLIKKLLNLILFSLISHNLGGMKIMSF